MIANVHIRSNVLSGSGYQQAFRHLSAYELYSIANRCRMLLNHGMFAANGERLWPNPEVQWPQWVARLFWGDRSVAMKDDQRQDWAGKLLERFAQPGSLADVLEAEDEETLMEWLCVVRLAQVRGIPDSKTTDDLWAALTKRLKDLDPSLTDLAIETRVKEMAGP